MNKRFSNAVLYGALGASAICLLPACNNNDVDDLKTRVGVIETAVNDLQSQLNKALTVGASVTNVEENNGTYILTLSDGQKITIKPGSGSMSIVMTDTEAVITVGDQVYKLPLGSSVSSLVYAPDFTDGLVQINDASGAEVRFLPRPAMTDIDGAEFKVAESHKLMTRSGDGDVFKVGSAELRDGFVVLKLLCLDESVKGENHAVSIQMSYKGTVIGSDYFQVQIDRDFSFVSEDIDPSIVCSAPGAVQNGNAWQFQLDGTVLGSGVNLAQYFNAPEGAEFRVAATSKQPGGPAQEKQQLLSSSLKADGSFNWSARPATAFNENEEQQGFLVNIVKDEVTVAKFYLTINDELADTNFFVFDSGMEIEYGNRTTCLALGAQRLDVQEWLSTAEEEEGGLICHGGLEGVVQKWNSVAVTTPSGKSVLFTAGGHLTLDELGQAYAPESTCRGIFWFYRGLSIRLPECMAPYVDWNGEEWTSGGEGWGGKYFENGDDMWWGQYNEYINTTWEQFAAPSAVFLGLRVDEKTGELITPENYTGWGFRMAYAVGYEYLYGVKNITSDGGDMLGMIFFNRRLAPEGAEMPHGDKE